jgi:archaellum component FlaC
VILEALVREFGLGVTLILIFVGALLAQIAGAAYGRLPERQVHRDTAGRGSKEKREQAAEAAAVERQEEITIVSQVIALQTRLVKQNDELIKFMTGTIDHSLNEIKQEIYDIDQRWLTVSKEFGDRSREHQTIQMQVGALIETLKRMEERVTSLAAYKAINEQFKHRELGERDEVSNQ